MSLRIQLARGVLDGIDDAGGYQTGSVRGLAGERYTEVLRPQPFGFSSVPPEGAEGLLFSLGAARDRAVFLGGEVAGLRPSGGAPGTSALYDHLGNIVRLVGQDGIRIAADGRSVTISGESVAITSTGAGGVTFSGTLRITGDVIVEGNISATGSIIDTGGNTNHHSH